MSASEDVWRAVDGYLTRMLMAHDDSLAAALKANAAARLPAQDVSSLQGKLLYLLARAVGAKTILEIGALGGYSGIWLARGLAAGGRLVTLESNPLHASVARANFERAGVGGSVEIRVGRAVEGLAQLVAEGQGPFDLVFIDADKAGSAEDLAWSLRLSRPGTLIICDNVVRDVKVADPDATDPSVQGVRRFLEMVAADPRVSTTARQTVGSKGHDGFAILRVEAIVLRKADRGC